MRERKAQYVSSRFGTHQGGYEMKASGLLLIVMALVLGLVPLVSDCESAGQSMTLANGAQAPMRCHWTGRAELAVAVPMMAVGGMMLTSKEQRGVRILSVMGIVLASFAILLPTVLIGVCSNPAMLCNTLMKPALILGGTVAAATSLYTLLLTFSHEASGRMAAERA
jgi:hypothetical protein